MGKHIIWVPLAILAALLAVLLWLGFQAHPPRHAGVLSRNHRRPPRGPGCPPQTPPTGA